MGLWSYRHRRLAATASAHDSVALRRGRNAIFRETFSPRTDARPNCPVLDPGVFGSPLWTANARGVLPTRTPGPNCGYRADCRRDGRSDFHSRKERKKTGAKLAD